MSVRMVFAFLFALTMMIAGAFVHVLLEIWEEKWQRKKAERDKMKHMKKLENEQ